MGSVVHYKTKMNKLGCIVKSIMLAEIYHECIKDHIACRMFTASSPLTNSMITNVDSHGVNDTN